LGKSELLRFDHLVDGREKPGEKTYAERVLS
jgi:hypothetical protein